jgi:uncharacterized protein (DUF488 family)
VAVEAAAVKRLFTIGYEAKTLSEFLDELTAAGVEAVLDVRAVAASRRPGFSKTALSGALAERGIGYRHFRALGTPSDGRTAARAGRIGEMRLIYAGQLETAEAALQMAQAIEAAQEKPSALLCYERGAPDCHRSMLAQRMVAQAGFEVVDI